MVLWFHVQQLTRGNNMYQTITQSMFHDAFIKIDRKENFSYEGRNALFDYIEGLEEDTGEKIELDVIGLCCEYAEDDIENVLKSYGLESLDELKDNTAVIWHNDLVVLY